MRAGDENMFCLKWKAVTEAEEGERGERKKGESGEEGTRKWKRKVREEERIGSRWWEEDGCLLCPSRT